MYLKYVTKIILYVSMTLFLGLECIPSDREASKVFSQEAQENEADALHRDAYNSFQNQDLEEAVSLWQQALGLYRERNNLQKEAETLDWLGIALLSQDKYRQAIHHLEILLPLSRGLQERTIENRTLAHLATAYSSIGQYSTAIELNEQALAMSRQTQEQRTESGLLTNLGNIYREMGDYDSAIQHYQEAKDVAQEVSDTNGYQSALLNLGSTELEQGRITEAIEYFERSFIIANRSGNNLGKAHSLLQLGIAHHLNGNLDRAEYFYNQSLKISPLLLGTRHHASVIGSLGMLYEDKGDSDRSLDYYQQGLDSAIEMESPILQSTFLNNIGHALHGAGRLAEAEQALVEAVEILDSIRPGLDDAYNISVFDTQASTFNLLLQVLVDRGDYQTALEVAEHGRSRAFSDLLFSRRTHTSLDDIPYELPDFQRLQELSRQFDATFVEYVLIPEEEHIFQGRLSSPTANIFIFVVRPDGDINFHDIKLEDHLDLPIDVLVDNSRQKLGGGERGLSLLPMERNSEPPSELHSLHQILIEPISEFLPTDPEDRVVFIPHESLFLVPFQALMDSEGNYLIEKHTILTSPAIHILEQMGEQRPTDRALGLQDSTIVGNPYPMPSIPLSAGETPQQLSSLKGAEREAIAIANLLNVDPILQEEATKEFVLQQLPTSHVIHFATHGILDDFQNRDTPGAIALAPDGEDSGFLTADEIFELNLSAELVVLSACDTGRGEITGDGVIGLSRSFIAAGVPSVVVSLWAVPDSPTESLMTDFYRNWLDLGYDKAQSLRRAMLSTMEDRPNPRDWAAFTLIGEFD